MKKKNEKLANTRISRYKNVPCPAVRETKTRGTAYRTTSKTGGIVTANTPLRGDVAVLLYTRRRMGALVCMCNWTVSSCGGHIVRTHQTGAALVSLGSAAAIAFAAGWANAAAREPVAREKMLARVRNCMADGNVSCTVQVWKTCNF